MFGKPVRIVTGDVDEANERLDIATDGGWSVYYPHISSGFMLVAMDTDYVIAIT